MIPLLALLVSSTLAAAPASLGPEIPVGDTAFGNAALGQQLAGVASNGRDYLVLWNDSRSLPFGARRAALYAGRVDAAGHPTDPPGHKLVDDAEGQIVWNGTSYVLIYDVQGISFEQLLDDDGKPLGPPMHLDLGGPSLAIGTNRGNVLTVDASGEVFLAGFDGTVTRQHAGHQLDGVSQIGAAPDGNYFFAATWSECVGPCAQHMELERVDGTTGVVTHFLRSDVSYGTQISGAATDDGRLLIAWNDPKADQFSVRYEIVDAAGHVLAGPALLANATPLYAISTGWDGRDFLVAFADQSWRLASNGPVLEHAAADRTPLLFACSAGGVLEARTVSTAADVDVFVRAAPSFAQLAASEQRSVAVSSRLQARPRLAASEAGFVAWFEFSPSPSLMVQPAGGAVTHIADVAPWNAYLPPALGIARGGNSVLVAWEAVVGDKLGFLAKRVALDGTPLDAEPIPFAFNEDFSYYDGSRTISIAFDGTNFLAVWPASNGAIHGVRIAQSGKLLDDAPLVLAQPNGHAAVTPRVVWNGKNFVVAWLDEIFCFCLISPAPPPTVRVYVIRAGSDGRPLDSTPIVLWDKQTYFSSLALATNGDDAALVWTGTGCVYAATLRADGTPGGDPQTVTCRPLPNVYSGSFDNAGVAWSGSEYVAIWTNPDSRRLHAERLDFSGSAAIPIDSGVDVSPAGLDASQPDIASTAAGVAIAYVRPAPESQFGGAPRIFIRILNRLGVLPRRRPSR